MLFQKKGGEACLDAPLDDVLSVQSFVLWLFYGRPISAQGFRGGDVNVDGCVDVADVLALLAGVLLGAEALPCAAAADVDQDGTIDLPTIDAFVLLTWMFESAPIPPLDPFTCHTASVLDCATPPRELCVHSTRLRLWPGGGRKISIRDCLP